VTRQPTFETERLVLRPYRDGDRASFIALHTDQVVRQYMKGPLPLDVANERFKQHLNRIDGFPMSWAITRKGHDEFIGRVSLFESAAGGGRDVANYGRVELGYLLAEQYWGLGFATEAVKRIMEFALSDLSLPCIVADVDLNHHASRRVLEKCGFTWRSRGIDEHGEYDVFRIQGPAG